MKSAAFKPNVILSAKCDEPGEPVGSGAHGHMDARGGVALAPSVIRLGGLDFEFVEPLTPELDTSGVIREFIPQERYAKSAIVRLHKHGDGTFCKFRISVPRELVGVYALVVAGSVRYIGECEDLGKRFSSGYGAISPKNCYVGGRTTNCKINRRVLDVSKAGGRVDLYFHQTMLRKTVEKQLIASYSPHWND